MDDSITQALRRYRSQGYHIPPKNILKTPKQIELIRESGKVNIAILDDITRQIADGITTGDIDRLIHEKTLALGGKPAPLGFHGFPRSVCVSVNNEVCHGIPNDNRVLKNGDIFNIDVSTVYKGFFSDSSRMFSLGAVPAGTQRLVRVAKECMDRGIEQVRPWGLLGDIGAAINEHAAENGYSIVREIGGHGIGCEFHEKPYVGYVTKRGTGMLMVPGMIFTVEPMVNMGSPGVYEDQNNGWTIRTVDGKPSAQWESMVLVTETGHEILAY